MFRILFCGCIMNKGMCLLANKETVSMYSTKNKTMHVNIMDDSLKK